jgi:hypothetical protein
LLDPIPAVPEPASWLMMLTGGAGFGIYLSRRAATGKGRRKS